MSRLDRFKNLSRTSALCPIRPQGVPFFLVTALTEDDERVTIEPTKDATPPCAKLCLAQSDRVRHALQIVGLARTRRYCCHNGQHQAISGGIDEVTREVRGRL